MNVQYQLQLTGQLTKAAFSFMLNPINNKFNNIKMALLSKLIINSIIDKDNGEAQREALKLTMSLYQNTRAIYLYYISKHDKSIT